MLVYLGMPLRYSEIFYYNIRIMTYVIVRVFFLSELCCRKKKKQEEMHEMSIVANIVEIVEDEAIKVNAEKITEIELDIGTVSGIEIDALNFAFESIKPKTMLKNAEVKINIIKAKSKCEDCNYIFETDTVYNLCPECDSYKTDIIQGKEMKIKSFLTD